MTFMPAPTLPRPAREVNRAPADFEGYDAWSASLQLEQEPPPDAPQAAYLTTAEFWAIADDATPAPPAKPSAREQRGRELAEAGHVHRHSEALFVVVGSRGDRYLVRRDERRHSCDCLDFERYGAWPLFVCKHGWAAAISTSEGLVVNARGARA